MYCFVTLQAEFSANQKESASRCASYARAHEGLMLSIALQEKELVCALASITVRDIGYYTFSHRIDYYQRCLAYGVNPVVDANGVQKYVAFSSHPIEQTFEE